MHTRSRVCRQQRKVTVVAERKVKELITSAKKQKNGGLRSNKVREVEEARDLNTTFDFVHEENNGLCVAYNNSFDDERHDGRSEQCVPDTIFSPTYHHPKEGCGTITDKVDILKCFKKNDQMGQHNHVAEKTEASALSCHVSLGNKHDVENKTQDTCTQLCDKHAVSTSTSVQKCDKQAVSTSRPSETKDTEENDAQMPQIESNNAKGEYGVAGNLSSEVSAIYLAMQYSKLECLDEQNHESMSTEDCAESDDSDDFDDFDPYTFIKDLPDLSAVVPKFRPVLLPKQTRSCPSITLVLDLDETLVHSSLEPCPDADFTFPVNFNLKEHTIYVRCRPYLKDFMERVSGLFETIIFTASQSIYAERLLNILDPKRRFFRHRVYRDSCVYVEGNYLKDLSILGRDLEHVVIIDNSPQAFGFQLDNGIPIESWFDDRTDQALLLLLPFLESLVGVGDVRPLITKKFNLREKVACSGIFLSASESEGKVRNG